MSYGDEYRHGHGDANMSTETNNHANRDYVVANPDDEDPMYAHIACDVAIQTAKPRALEEVMNLDVGEQEGNREWLLCYARGSF